MFYTLKIPAGTKVLSSKRGLVSLRADVEVSDATRDADGAFRYSVLGTAYLVAAGCCEFTAAA